MAAPKTALLRDASGIAQLEYVLLLSFVTVPLYLALLPVGAAIYHSYVASRNTVLGGAP